MLTLYVLKYEDTIDSRDVIDRIEELEAVGDPEDADELAILREFAEEASGYFPDWKYGETLIRDSYFRDYAEVLADDLGAIDSNASWPLTHIDWDGAAADLQQDYTATELDGVTYWGRS